MENVGPDIRYEAIRREIEVRLQRETIYRAVEALNAKTTLDAHIKANDEKLDLLGKFILESFGDEWEKKYREQFPR